MTPTVVQQLSESELMRIIGGFDAVIAGDDPFTAKVLEQAHRLKFIAKWGVGLDAIDLAAARRLRIEVQNTPAAFADEVADVAVGYMVLLARHLHRLDRSVREGGWLKVQGVSLKGKTLGIVGLGSIGRALVVRARAMGMLVCGTDPKPVPEDFRKRTQVALVSLQQLLARADFICLSCSLTEESFHLIDQEALRSCKKGVFLINIARGPLIDERVLPKALDSGLVAGAALDVFESEPLPANSLLRKYEQCIFGTHNSSNTTEAVLRVNSVVVERVISFLKQASL